VPATARKFLLPLQIKLAKVGDEIVYAILYSRDNGLSAEAPLSERLPFCARGSGKARAQVLQYSAISGVSFAQFHRHGID
jgi:hypothetical protein